MARRLLPLLLLPLGGSVAAAGLALDIELPRMQVAEYHRPYVAAWIEHADRSVAANLAAWYMHKDASARPGAAASAGKDGSEWLPDLRQWWRRSGRTLSLPVDGVTGATRPPGTHSLRFDDASAPLAGLAAGEYQLVVEAVREVGGRELLRIPFTWPPVGPATQSATGSSELGSVTLQLIP